MLGFEFDDSHTGEAFSVFNMAQAFAVFGFEMLEAHIDSYERYLIYSSVLGCIGLFSAAIAYFFDFK